MGDIPMKFQLFAITFLLTTPSELHNVWIVQGLSWPTIAAHLVGLGFSQQAIDEAENRIFNKLTEGLKGHFRDTASALSGTDGQGDKLDIYDAGSHPANGEAGTIATKMRAADESLLLAGGLELTKGSRK